MAKKGFNIILALRILGRQAEMHASAHAPGMHIPVIC